MNEYEWWHKITRKWFIQYSYENLKIGGKQNTPITNQWENQWENLDGKQIPRSQIDDQINEKIWMGSNIPRSQMKKKSNWWNYLEAKYHNHRTMSKSLQWFWTRGKMHRSQTENRIDENADKRHNTPMTDEWSNSWKIEGWRIWLEHSGREEKYPDLGNMREEPNWISKEWEILTLNKIRQPQSRMSSR